MISRVQGRWRSVLSMVSLAVLYALMAGVGLRWATAGSMASPVYPAAGLAVAWLLVGGVRLWPGVVLGRLLVFWFDGVEEPFWMQLVASLGTAAAAGVAASGLRSWARIDPALTRLRDILWLTGWAALATPVIGATIGAGARALAFGFTGEQFAGAWFNWWVGNVTGVLIVTPFVLGWACGESPPRDWRYWTHLGICLLSGGILSGLVFLPNQVILLRTWFLFPVFIWAALAFGVRGAATIMLLSAFFGVWGVTHGGWPLAAAIGFQTPVLLLQQFIAIASVTTLVLAVVADERRSQEAIARHAEELRLLSEQLRETQDRLATTLTAAEIGTWNWELPEPRVQLDANLIRLFSVPPDISPEGVPFEFVRPRIHPEDRDTIGNGFKRLRAGENQFETEFRLLREDGSIRWVIARGRAQRDEDGQLVSVPGVVVDITERRMAEEAVYESEERFRNIADNSPMMIWVVRPDGYCTYLNRPWYEFTGQTEGMALGFGWLDAVHPADAQRAAEVFFTALDTQQPFRLEYRLRRYDGEYMWCIDAAAPRFNASGEFLGYVGSVIDISDRKSIEEAWRTSEERLRLAISAAGMCAFEWDIENDSVQRVMPADEASFGITTEELGTTWEEYSRLIYEVDRATVNEAMRFLRPEQPIYQVEYRLVRRDGELLWAQDVARAEFDEFGKVVRIRGVVLNVTERKRAEELVREGQELYRTLMEANPISVILTDLDGSIRYANDAFFKLVGWDRTDLERGQLHWLSITPPEWLPRDEEAIAESIQNGFCAPYEKEYIHKDGHRVPILVGFALVGKGPRHAVAFVVDLTSRKAAEVERERLLNGERLARMEAERASQLKDEFLATLSHELRTPLNAILGWAQLIRSGRLPEASAHEGLRVIERNAKLQAQLIEDLLDMSRIVSGKLRLEVSPVNLAEIVRASVDTVKPAADAKGVRFVVELDEHVEAVSGDSSRLQQVVWNLLSNAVKFTPSGGQVEIRLERVNSHAEISVTDTGEGIAVEFLPYVFDRFRQADGTITRQHGGLGLGLSIVRNLVELHGGTVMVHSAGEGRGATFTVSLPLASELETELPPASQEAPPVDVPDLDVLCKPVLRGVKVLVVDDSIDSRELVRVVLERCGAHVAVASSAAEAMELLRGERPEVLISDIGMPEADGYDLIRWVRALPQDKGGQTPAIALTAFAQAEDRNRTLNAGFQRHLSKPIDAAEMLAQVADLVEAPLEN